jgi:hypothetical protein
MSDASEYGPTLTLDEALDIAITSDDARVPIELLSPEDRFAYHSLARFVARLVGEEGIFE